MAEALGDPLSPSPASERVARFDVDPPPGTMSLVGEVTHVPRLAADHLRHAVLTGSGAVDLASKLGGFQKMLPVLLWADSTLALALCLSLAYFPILLQNWLFFVHIKKD